LQLLDPLGSSEIDSGFFDSLIAGCTITASLVVSKDGDFVSSDGTSKGLSDTADRAWLSALRRNSEVVLTTGETFRVEQYRMPKTADLAVMTKSVLDTDHLEPRPGQLFRLLNELDSLPHGISELKNLGYKKVHVEFGPTGMQELLKSNLDFTLFLTGNTREALEVGAGKLGAQLSHLCKVDTIYMAKAR
jgi:hypothetical protein